VRRLRARLLETTLLALVLALGFRFPSASGRGYLDAAAGLLFPILFLAALFRGRNPGWLFLAAFLGLVGIFHWVPGTIAVKAPMPYPEALLGAGLFYGYEAAGVVAVALLARWALRRGGPWAAAWAAALAMLLWERHGFHVYSWCWGTCLSGVPWMAKSAAFLGGHGLSALAWGAAGWAGAALAEGRRPRRILAGPAAVVAVLAAGALLWPALPRKAPLALDVVVIQPNFESGVRRPGMEQEMWARSDAELKRLGWPRAGVATLLLWPESSVLGRDDRHPDPRLGLEARRRGVAWLYGTEGGDFNLVRGEAAGQPSFIQGKVEPMPFGERMPGPPAVSAWLDRQLGFTSQRPGLLTPESSFRIPTPQGVIKAHPLICSEALLEDRVRDGLRLAGGDLLTNHTNDGWFEHSPATDLHAAQIRLRAVESGLPLVRATLTGKSGLFQPDGSWELWGQPMTEAAYGIPLRWRPIATPARSPWVVRGLLAALVLALAASLARARTSSDRSGPLPGGSGPGMLAP
jgi:apolipoprotein N-acyltransferase